MKYFLSESGVLSKETVDQLASTLDRFMETKRPAEHMLPNLQYGIEYSLIKNKVEHVVEDLIGPFKSPGCFLMRCVDPHTIHTDWPNSRDDMPDDHEPYCAVLFPLRFDGPCSTVVFPETAKQYTLDDISPKTNDQYRFDAREQQELGHIKSSHFDKLSDPVFIKWNVGDAIVWRRQHLHCADNFHAHGTTFKDSLVLWTTKEK